MNTQQSPTGSGKRSSSTREPRRFRSAFKRGASLAAATSLAVLAPAGLAAGAASSGWGTQSSYLGRYHVRLLPLARGVQASLALPAQAAVFSKVASACQQIAKTSSFHPTSGELTMFMREVKKGKPLVPSGILDIRASGSDDLLYLTYLSAKGSTLAAKVNGGAFVGPVIGSFSGKRTGAGRITGTTTVEGLGAFTAEYVRFSTSPQP
jgi:hypothetical protein